MCRSDYAQQQQHVQALNICFVYTPKKNAFLYSEVFKAREKKSPKKFVAMKKVLMENEKEGVSEHCK